MLLVTRFSELEDHEEAYGYHVTKPQKMRGLLMTWILCGDDAFGAQTKALNPNPPPPCT